jgi:uncharacterized membrane protein
MTYQCSDAYFDIFETLLQMIRSLDRSGWQMLLVSFVATSIFLFALFVLLQVLEKLLVVEMNSLRWTRVFFGTPTKQ